MPLTPEKTEKMQTVRVSRERDVQAEAHEPKPWTAPDFVERSTCAEIGAYAFQDK
jgi:coenzyme PQQ precursor peptide PqqA